MMLSPALFLLAVAGFIPLLPRRLLALVLAAAPIAALVLLWQLPVGTDATFQLLRHEFHWLTVGGYSQLFSTAFLIILWASTLMALTKNRRLEITSGYIYAASGIGMTLAGDLITLLIWWELMAIASTLVIWSAGTSKARAAGLRYAAMHFLGGLLMLEGISFYVATHATDTIASLPWQGQEGLLLKDYLGEKLIFLGMLINLAAPPFSAWLKDAYPEASSSGAVLLSGITTKTAVYVALMLFPGHSWLVPIGVVMVFYGILMALMENDLRRILSYSIINQVGFMVTAIGMGSELALLGAAAHAFCHIIYKALLMMTAGVVVDATGERRCSDLGGLYRRMPFTTACAIIGALAISAFPLTSGFVSKSLVVDAAAEAQHLWLWLALMAANAGVFLHAGIKYPWFVFFQRPDSNQPKLKKTSPTTQIAMAVLALLCLLPAWYPAGFYQLLPNIPDAHPYAAAHVLSQLQLLAFSALAFFLCLPWLKRTRTETIDTDWLWRVLGLKLLLKLEAATLRLYHYYNQATTCLTSCATAITARLHAPGRLFSNSVTSSTLMLLTALMLAFYLFSGHWASKPI